MRIIGGRDYYDTATAQYGVDSTVCFVRKHNLVQMNDTPLNYSAREAGGFYLYRFEVVVAGEIYKCLRVAKSTAWGQPRYATRFIYDQAEATSFSQDLPNFIRDWSDLSISDARRNAIRDWALDNKVVTAVSGAETRQINDYNRHPYALFEGYTRDRFAILNSDCLKTIEFYRVLPPAEAHRAIASWVGGVLPFNAPTVEISDRSKIKKAGFDLVTSFRKQKA
jgi:hypothetical protein